jgi:hypothetical protein
MPSVFNVFWLSCPFWLFVYSNCEIYPGALPIYLPSITLLHSWLQLLDIAEGARLAHNLPPFAEDMGNP